jgi:hypothetical protein
MQNPDGGASVGFALQRPDAQSAFEPQTFPSAQPVHPQQPQSTSLSLPFLIPSLQECRWQTPFVHLLAQSASVLQVMPGPHRAHAFGREPQSTPLSSPFLIPSVHEGGAQLAPAGNPQTSGRLQPKLTGPIVDENCAMTPQRFRPGIQQPAMLCANAPDVWMRFGQAGCGSPITFSPSQAP